MANYKVYYHKVSKEISGYDFDKYYIGISCKKNLIERWGRNGEGYKVQPFYNAIQKYGWDNIEHKILFENLTGEEAKNMEICLIQTLDSQLGHKGYNNTMGGDGVKGIDQVKCRNIYCKELNAVFKNVEIASNITGVSKGTINNRCKSFKDGILSNNRNDNYHFCYIEQMYKMYTEEKMYKKSQPVVSLHNGKVYGSVKIANKILGTNFSHHGILNLQNYLKRKGNNTLYKTNRVMYLEDYLKVFDNTYYC